MKCLTCEFENPGTAAFCKQCGAKLDLTVEEIAASLVANQKIEKKKQTEYWMRQSLFLSAVAFLAAMTFYIFSGGGPEEGAAYYVPAATTKSEYAKLESKFDPSVLSKRPLFTLVKP